MIIRNKLCSNIRGFTLIELSIVMVIIGLIIGGVLTGKTLIKSAEIRKNISTLENYGSAVSSFKLKYNCLPGDCKNITEIFPSGTYAGNGNGDGFINNWPNESMTANDSLVLAGFVKKELLIVAYGHTQDSYLGCYNGGYGYLYFADLYSIDNDFSWTYGNPIVLPAATKKGLTFTCTTWDNGGSLNMPVISANDSYAMDSKIDDGKPQSGNFLAQSYSGICTTGNAYQNSDIIGCRTVTYLPKP